MKTKEDFATRARAEVIAERVKLLLGFCFDLVPDLDLLEKMAKEAPGRADSVLSMAPILEAFGQDHEVMHFNRSLEAARGVALYKLIKILKETEDSRKEFREMMARKKTARAQLVRALGGV